MVASSRKPPPTQRDFHHTWYIREWMAQAEPPRKQADMIRELGFSRATASAIYNGQQYTQSLIDKLAPWLNARPYELLLPPERAFALRRMEQSAKEIASDPAIAPDPDAPAMLRVVK